MRWAAARTRCTEGSKSPIRTPMIPITTTSSIRVKPRRGGMRVLGACRQKGDGNTIIRTVIPDGKVQGKGPGERGDQNGHPHRARAGDCINQLPATGDWFLST